MRKIHIIKDVKVYSLYDLYVTNCGLELEHFDNKTAKGYCKRCFVNCRRKEK